MAFEKSDRSSRPMHRGRKKVWSFCVDRVYKITDGVLRTMIVAEAE